MDAPVKARIREFRPGDATAVRAVVERVLREYGHLASHRPGMGDLEDIPGSYLRFLVVESGSKIVGCGGLLRYPRRQAQLKRMYLLPAARGKGLGLAMLKRLMAHAKKAGLRRVWLESSLRYQDALRLYLANGFEGGLIDCDGCCGVVLFRDLGRR